MLTGVSDKDKIREALDSGISYYMVKPFEFHDLISKVKIAIADSENSQIS
jgi:AmiR/NasT family two-component response regulator